MERKIFTELVAAQALMQGKEEGLDFFFHQYYAPLTYFAIKITGETTTAEDIVADAFVTLWNNRENLSQPNSIKPYLYRTVRNAAIDFLRTKSRVEAYRKEVIYLNEISEVYVVQKFIEAETYNNIYESIQSLPPKCGLVFRMFYLQGKSYQQIADELNISVNTVRNQKVRAKEILKEKFSKIVLSLLLMKNINYNELF